MRMGVAMRAVLVIIKNLERSIFQIDVYFTGALYMHITSRKWADQLLVDHEKFNVRHNERGYTCFCLK